MSALLERSGFVMTDSPDDASFVLLETCAIRQKAEDKVISELGRLRKRRRRGDRTLKIGVAGCMVTPEAAGDLSRRLGVDIVLGPRRIARVADAYFESFSAPVIDIGNEWALPPADVSAPDVPGVSAFVSVMQGCSNNCAFCVVPSRRGPAESRPADSIIEEVRRLALTGYREVTLIGQNISYYGIDAAGEGDRPENTRLIDLLKRVEGETAIGRIRFATSHPAYINGRFIEGFGRLERVMPHLHLPAQSGSNAVLGAMRRGYSAERYEEIVERVRAARPDVAITTDFIAGFDGETIADHEATLALCHRIRFDGAYVYWYSERPGTTAGEKGGAGVLKVPVTERRRRCGEILAEIESIAREKRLADVGKTVTVLAESADAGRTPQNFPVFFQGGTRGRLEEIRVDEATPFSLKGTVVGRAGA